MTHLAPLKSDEHQRTVITAEITDARAAQRNVWKTGFSLSFQYWRPLSVVRVPENVLATEPAKGMQEICPLLEKKKIFPELDTLNILIMLQHSDPILNDSISNFFFIKSCSFSSQLDQYLLSLCSKADERKLLGSLNFSMPNYFHRIHLY